MKNLFKNKLNIVLMLLLMIAVAALTVFILNVTNVLGLKKVEAIDFSGYTKEKVEGWVLENELEEGKYSYSFEYDETIPENEVIYQSVKVGEPIEDSLKIVYSKGQDPDAVYTLIVVEENTSVDEVTKWFNQKGFSNVYYQYVNSDKLLGTVLNIDKNEAKKSDTIVVTVSCYDDDGMASYLVPDLSALSREDISAWASGYGINIEIENVVKPELDENTFVSQTPERLSTIKKGDTVKITYSSKEEKEDIINVPDSYLGLSEDKFISTIKSLGLKANKKATVTNSKYKTGTIYAYDSSSDGFKFKKGDTVNYTVIDNKDADQYVTVGDNYIGMKEADFIKTIEALGLKPLKQQKVYQSAKYSTGTVYAYDSSSDGITFKKGDNVKYNLVDNGDGPDKDVELVTVPDTYIGYKEADFIKAIEALGLKANKQTTTYKSQKYKTGEVYAYQSTSDGITFKKGDTVKYYLVDNGDSSSSDNLTVTVPDSYIGYKEADFIKAIENLGLKASKQSKTYTSQKYKTGEVYAYDSSSDGITFKKGDTVKYYLVNNNDGGNESTTVTVPDTYIGYKEADFIKAIEALGLKASKQSKTYTSQKYKTGDVYAYDSSSDGIVFKKGDTVKYYLVKNDDTPVTPSNPPETDNKVTLANLVNQSKDSANTYCVNNGLTATFSETYSDTVSKGYVVSMNPGAGTSVSKGATISFVISKGKQPESEGKAILASNTLINFYSKSTYSETVTAISKYFNDAGFTNVSCSPAQINESNRSDFYDVNVGTIISVSVNGNTDYSSSTKYPLSTPIVVTILDQEIN